MLGLHLERMKTSAQTKLLFQEVCVWPPFNIEKENEGMLRLGWNSWEEDPKPLHSGSRWIKLDLHEVVNGTELQWVNVWGDLKHLALFCALNLEQEDIHFLLIEISPGLRTKAIVLGHLVAFLLEILSWS